MHLCKETGIQAEKGDCPRLAKFTDYAEECGQARPFHRLCHKAFRGCVRGTQIRRWHPRKLGGTDCSLGHLDDIGSSRAAKVKPPGADCGSSGYQRAMA